MDIYTRLVKVTPISCPFKPRFCNVNPRSFIRDVDNSNNNQKKKREKERKKISAKGLKRIMYQAECCMRIYRNYAIVLVSE